MKTQMVQIEAVDSLESLVEKIASTRTVRVLMLDQGDNPIPRDEVLSRILIRRCLQQGKQIGFVTRDREAISLWTSLEISVFPDVVTAEHEVWQTISGLGQLDKRLPRKTSLPSDVRESKPKHSTELNHFWRVAIFSIAILSVIGLIVSLLPSSRIVINMPRMDTLVEYPVQISTTFSQVSLSGQIPAREYQYPFNVIQSIPSSGKVDLDDQFATGEVVIRGNPSKEPIIIGEGTILSTIGDPGIEYKTVADATLTIGKNASVVVPVMALVPGETGNIPANTEMDVIGEFGSTLKAMNAEPFTGGGANTFPIPSDVDRITLREKIESQIEQQGVEKVVAENTEHVWIVPGSFRIARSDAERYYPVNGTPGDSLTLEMSGTASVLIVNQEDLVGYIEKVAQADALAPERILTGSIQVSGLTAVKSEPGSISQAILSATLVKIPRVDTGRMPYQLAGKPSSLVQDLVRNQIPSAATILLENRPGWWPWVAALPMQVQVEVR